ncbi:hypothetical protein DRE_01296 [Drechslerella stenobrocha 248]|uniref:Uncharacterized protein n=1 Tax=Drechslerella stenobrocha 248 TaxID=1043628 RepID=W7HLJ2_9PEZI|nr:hypothetical protein DRE_01296 [Drechslerella stenobrocha 248]
MKVCKLWKQILESEELQYQRFSEESNPPHHLIAPELNFTLRDGKVSSATIRPDRSNRYTQLAVRSVDPDGILRSLASVLSAGNMLAQLSQPDREAEAMTRVELSGSGVLDDPLFYHDPVGTVHVHPQTKRKLRGLAFCGTTWTDPTNRIPSVEGGAEWKFEDHPELKSQSLRQFVSFAAKLVAGSDRAKRHEQITFKLKIMGVPNGGYLYFGLEPVRN